MQGVSIFISQQHFQIQRYISNLQTDSKFAIIFLSFDMYFNEKRVEKRGEFNYIYKLFNVFSTYITICLLPVY